MEQLKACLHGGGGPQKGEVTCGRSPHPLCKRDHIKMRYYMDRRVTPPKRVTSPTRGPPPPCKQALSYISLWVMVLSWFVMVTGLHVTSRRPCWWSRTKAFLSSGN